MTKLLRLKSIDVEVKYDDKNLPTGFGLKHKNAPLVTMWLTMTQLIELVEMFSDSDWESPL